MYGDPVTYKSPLRMYENLPELVVYKCSQTEAVVGKVYKTPEGKWFLSTRYIGHWQPISVRRPGLSPKERAKATLGEHND